MTQTLAIDPGTHETAFALLDGETLLTFGKSTNEEIRKLIRSMPAPLNVTIEMIACYGKSVGREVFETAVWIGRFMEIAVSCDHWVHLRVRLDVKLHHCHSPRASDSNVRQAIVDRFGGKAAAIGSKRRPGPLYGVKADVWQALALGLMFLDQQAPAAAGSEVN